MVRFAFAAATALACASAFQVEDGAGATAMADVAAAGRAARTLMMLPLNVAVPMPKDLEVPSLKVWQELADHLGAHGKQLKTVSYEDARRLWRTSVARARQSEKNDAAVFAAAMSLLAVELRRHAEFDAVVVPSVLVRQADISGTRATWDGVTRQLDIRTEDRRAGRGELRASRTARSASLHVAVFDASGHKIHVGVGGLDVLVRAYVDPGFSEYLATGTIWYVERRPDIFEDPALLHEGIAKALDPFLSPEVTSPEARKPEPL